MVEECQVDGTLDCSHYILDLFIRGLWMWTTGLAKVCWIDRIRRREAYSVSGESQCRRDCQTSNLN